LEITITVKIGPPHTKSWRDGIFPVLERLAPGRRTAFLLVLLAFVGGLDDTNLIVGDVWLKIFVRAIKCVEL